MSIPKPAWILRFGTHLHKLRPLIPSAKALALAAKAFDQEPGRQPENAAEAYAEVMAPEDRDEGMSSDADA